MTDAIERLRANVDNGTKSPMTHCSKANLRALLDDYDALRTIAEQLAEALRETQWGYLTKNLQFACPKCRMADVGLDKHADGCPVAAALGAWEEFRDH